MNDPIAKYTELGGWPETRSAVRGALKYSLRYPHEIMNLSWNALCKCFSVDICTLGDVYEFGWNHSDDTRAFFKKVEAVLAPPKPFNEEDYL